MPIKKAPHKLHPLACPKNKPILKVILPIGIEQASYLSTIIIQPEEPKNSTPEKATPTNKEQRFPSPSTRAHFSRGPSKLNFHSTNKSPNIPYSFLFTLINPQSSPVPIVIFLYARTNQMSICPARAIHVHLTHAHHFKYFPAQTLISYTQHTFTLVHSIIFSYFVYVSLYRG